MKPIDFFELIRRRRSTRLFISQPVEGQKLQAILGAANRFNPGGTGAILVTCDGGSGYNGFYGHGQVNALSAVTHAH